jgi:hypothetical protein
MSTGGVHARLCAVEDRLATLEGQHSPDPDFVTVGSALEAALAKLGVAVANAERARKLIEA